MNPHASFSLNVRRGPGGRGYVHSVARKPHNLQWLGFTAEQADLLDFIDYLGNNGWARNSQTDEVMPGVLDEVKELGMTLAQVQEAMRSIGYHKEALRMLDRWESKRTTGKFGR